MRLSERNKQPIYYALYDGTEQTTDENGLYTGENPPKYKPVVCERMVVGINAGSAFLEQFGINDGFSVKVATDDISCPIDTASVIWLGLGEVNNYNESCNYSDGDMAIIDGKPMRYEDGDEPKWAEVPYTHAVVRVSKSMGYITYLLKEVTVS